MSYRVNFGELEVSEESRQLLNYCADTNIVSGGPLVKRLEKEWGELFNYKHNVAVSNGTDADTAACLALYDHGARRGDEIIAPALAFVAVGNSILSAGYNPSFVDVEKRTMNIDPNQIEERITPKTRAIMAVHTMGKPCDMDAITEIAQKHDLKVIEDCCEAHGAKYKDQYVGTFGQAATFSFYVAHLISCGDGGMVSTNDDSFAEAVRSVKDHGRKPNTLYFDHIRHGSNFRMNALTASIGLPEIPRFFEIFEKRRNNLQYLLNQTSDLGDRIIFNQEDETDLVTPHAFSLTLRDPKDNAEKLYNYLEKNGIMCKRNFGSMPTQHQAFKFMGHKPGEFPVAEYIGDNGLHFAIHQFLSQDDLDYCSDKLHEFFSQSKK